MASAFSAKDKDTYFAAMDSVAGIRNQVDGGTPAAPLVVKAYTEKVGILLGIAVSAASGSTSFGTGKVLNSVILVEDAKEAAGLLRAKMSSYVAADKPISEEQILEIIDLDSRMNADINSKAVLFDSASSALLKTALKHPGKARASEVLRVLLSRRESGGYGVDGEALFNVMTEYINEIAKVLSLATGGLVAKIATLSDAARNTMVLYIAFFIALTGGILGSFFLILRSVLGTTKKVSDSLENIARGEADLTVRIDVQATDEIGRLAVFFNMFVESLRGILFDIKRQTEATFGSSSQLREVSGKLTDSSDKTTKQSETVAAAAEEMSVTLSALSESMTHMYSNISVVASSTDEMTNTIGALAANAERARLVSSTAVESTRHVNETMTRLSSSASEIGDVTEAISAISVQTNMLALNASIEAARAGAAGKGFAIVANEIKELARQTSKATEDIRDKINGIQSSSQTASG